MNNNPKLLSPQLTKLRVNTFAVGRYFFTLQNKDYKVISFLSLFVWKFIFKLFNVIMR